MHRTRLGISALLTAGLMLGGCVREYGPARTDSIIAPQGNRVIHTVVAGDTIRDIARRYGVEIRTVIDANDLHSSTLTPGQKLVIPGGRLPAPTPAPEAPITSETKPAEPIKPTSDWYTPRSTWAVEPIVVARINPMGGKPTRITIHHSNMPGDTDPDTESVLRKIDREHHKAIGRNGEAGACIGYHFLIARNGTVYEGRPIQYQGAHAGGDNNKFNVGICLLGDYDHHAVPTAQKAAMVAVIDRLRATYGIARSQVFGHRDFNPAGTLHTECPGHYLLPLVVAYRRGDMGRDPLMETAVPMATATRP